jgi:hypothetical protein
MARILSEILAKRPVDRGAVDERKRWMVGAVEAYEVDEVRESGARSSTTSSPSELPAEPK